MFFLPAKLVLAAAAFACIGMAEAMHMMRKVSLNFTSATEDAMLTSDPLRADALRKLMATGMDVEGAQVRLHVAEQFREDFLKSVPKYVFGVSTGHVGSTTLSSNESYSASWPHTVFRFEDFLWGSSQGKQRIYVRSWWGSKPSKSSQLHHTLGYKDRADHILELSDAKTFVDLGHHNLHGLLGSTPEVFGISKVVLVRIRRSRQETAFSLAHVSEDVCDLWFRLCPTQDEVMLKPSNGHWSNKTWNKLLPYSKAFWFQDEVEAQYQRLLKKYPKVAHIECNWHKNLDPCLEAVALVLGLEVNTHVQQLKIHHELGDTADDHREELSAADAEYRKFMNYDSDTRRLIAITQF